MLLISISYSWALRNGAVFGQKVWTRSSFGISFAFGFHDKAIRPSDPKKVFDDRAKEISAFLNPKVLAELKAAGGEVGFNRLLTARTQEWLGEHPLGALRIAARHAWEFYFPARWMWDPDSEAVAGLKQEFMWAIGVIGFAGLGFRLAGRDWRYICGGATILDDAPIRSNGAGCSLPVPDWRPIGFPRFRHDLARHRLPVAAAIGTAVVPRLCSH